MPFSSSKIEAPEITGSLFGTASWALSASWAPSNGGGGVYQTAQSGTLFDVTISEPGSGPAPTRSIGGALQSGDVNIFKQTIYGVTQSYNLVYLETTTASVPLSSGGSGLPSSRLNGGNWSQVMTGDLPIFSTFLAPALSSSVENTGFGGLYNAPISGALYYDCTTRQYRIYKGVDQGGWQDLVNLQRLPYQTAQSGALYDVSFNSGSTNWTTRSIGGDFQPGDINVFNGFQAITGGTLAPNTFLRYYRFFNTGSSNNVQQAGTGQISNYANADRGFAILVDTTHPTMNTFKGAATSSVETALINGTPGFPGAYNSSSLSAATGSIYYATDLQRYRILKNKALGWEDLVPTGSTGGGGNLQSVTTAGNQTSASVIISAGLNVGANAVASTAGGFAQGLNVTASGNYAHAQGERNIAQGLYSHAEGNFSIAIGNHSHAEGSTTTSIGQFSHAEGGITTAVANFSHTEGNATISAGQFSHAEGISSTAAGQGSHAEGGIGRALGSYSHAEGFNTTAFGEASHAEGQQTFASGAYSHAEGFNTTASGQYSHAEGDRTRAIGAYSHAEGITTTAIGTGSHVEGDRAQAIGSYSHAEGMQTTARGDWSHTEGLGTITLGPYQHAQGMWNTISSDSGSFMIGNGTSNISRSNLVFASGSQVQITGSLLIQSASVNGEAVSNIGDTFTSTAKVTKMVTLTAAEYSALSPKDANTFYIVI